MNFRLIIAGSRTLSPTIKDLDIILQKVCPALPYVVIHGGAKGVDTCADAWGKKRNCVVSCNEPAWNGKYKKLAGHYRNRFMAEIGDGAVIIWDGQSTGSLGMIYEMWLEGKPIAVFTPYDPELSHEVNGSPTWYQLHRAEVWALVDNYKCLIEPKEVKAGIEPRILSSEGDLFWGKK